MHRRLVHSPTGLTWRATLPGYGYTWWQWVALALGAALVVWLVVASGGS
jgi:hypothetical protein